MDDLKDRIKAFLEEIEYIHLKKTWLEHLIAAEIDENDARTWAAEIGHVVEEYQSSLMVLAELLEESDPKRIPSEVQNWAVGIRVVTIPEIEEPMHYLEGQLEKYLPPEHDDEDDSS